MNSNPSGAAGAETLLDVLEQARRSGYAAQQIARTDGTVECSACEQRTPAEKLRVDRLRRLEGASDAADMLLVLWSHCPSCGQKGVLTLGYGPNASDDDDAIMEQLDLDDVDASPVIP